MNIRKAFLLFFLAVNGVWGALAQNVLTLDSCRSMALGNNKQLAIVRAQQQKALYDRKAAHTNYLPKVSLMAGYVRTGKEISLLSDDQKAKLSTFGTSLSSDFSSIAQQIVAQHPDLAPLVQGVGEQLGPLASAVDAAGSSLADAFRTDTRNMTVGTILLTQPLYMGGKIKAYERITEYTQSLADQQERAARQEVLLDVDKAYWQVVSLVNKRKLAIGYRDMLARLDSDMAKMIAEGVATKSNGLSVSVKLNEAEMTLVKVEDGLSLSRMLLNQLCGMPIEARHVLADEASSDLPADSSQVTADAATAFARRPEIGQLQLAQEIYAQKVKIERSAFLPQLALMGGYMLSNPNVFNSFEKKFRGTWAVGVTLKVPVWNWGEGKYKVQSAKADALAAELKTAEAREKIELQVNQEAFRVNEANHKYSLSMKNLEKAEENLRTAQVGFKEGVITTSDLLQAQTAWLQAHSDKIDSQIDLKLTRASYRKALGTLGME